MPLPVITAVEIEEWADKMKPALALQMSRSDVSRHTMAALAKNRVTTVMKYQMIADDPAGVEKVANALGLKAEDGMEAISEITGLKTAWAATRKFQQAEDQQKAETKVMGLVTPLKSSEYTSMRVAFERAHSHIEEKRLPGSSILNAIEA